MRYGRFGLRAHHEKRGHRTVSASAQWVLTFPIKLKPFAALSRHIKLSLLQWAWFVIHPLNVERDAVAAYRLQSLHGFGLRCALKPRANVNHPLTQLPPL